MKYPSLVKNTLLSAIVLGLSQPAMAVTDEEFNALREQFNQLADQMEANNQSGGDNSTSIGGYAELHYNNLSSDNRGEDKRELDLHRFVLFVNHEFNDDIRLFSEFEIEHGVAGDDQVGEVEVEQAYVQFDLNDNMKANAGVFLIPVGIMNETHEPPTFYGVERNPVEKNIIPATWWEGGAMLSGNSASGISYDVAIHSGLNVEADPTNSKFADIRSGRQKTGKAAARNLAGTARIKYTGTAGLELAGTLQVQDDITQTSNDGVDGATLIEAHARYSVSRLTLTALYANWDIDGDAAKLAKKDEQDGGYLEASYKVTPKLGFFVRQNEWDNGGTAADTSKSQTDVGVNYWPHEDVVIKADYQSQNDIAGDFDGFNLGVGYQF